MIQCAVGGVQGKWRMKMEKIMMAVIAEQQAGLPRNAGGAERALIRSLNVRMRVVEEAILERNIFIDIN
jgi:hypothetical protein